MLTTGNPETKLFGRKIPPGAIPGCPNSGGLVAILNTDIEWIWVRVVVLTTGCPLTRFVQDTEWICAKLEVPITGVDVVKLLGVSK